MSAYATYTTKAEKYARFRWDYDPRAVGAIFSIAHLSAVSTVADIGAGTGILTRHFLGRIARVYAIEPNAAMRRQAARRIPSEHGFYLIGASAEQVPLPDHRPA